MPHVEITMLKGRTAAEVITRIIRSDGKRPDNRIIDLGFTVQERESTRRR